MMADWRHCICGQTSNAMPTFVMIGTIADIAESVLRRGQFADESSSSSLVFRLPFVLFLPRESRAGDLASPPLLAPALAVLILDRNLE